MAIRLFYPLCLFLPLRPIYTLEKRGGCRGDLILMSFKLSLTKY